MPVGNGREAPCARWRRRVRREEDLSTEPARAQASPWVPQADVDSGRGSRYRAASGQGPQAAVGLSPIGLESRIRSGNGVSAGQTAAPMKIVTLKRPSDVKRVRGGLR